jgi:hypothetical protein
MQTSPLSANPFVLMMDPESVLRAVEASPRLSSLQRHICRPLDKPLIAPKGDAEVAEFDDDDDQAIDAAEGPNEATAV